MEETKECKYCLKKQDIIMFRKNRRKCKDCEKKDGREYRQSEFGKQKAKTWSDNNKEQHAKLQSDWAKNNREHINAKYNARIKIDFAFKLKKSCHRQLLENLKYKKSTTMKYFSCNIELFTEWLKYCFDDDMTMENHGSYWHLDHVIPIATFDLEKEQDLKLCFHYLNYMPLPAKENISKQDKIIPSQIIKHRQNIENFHKEKKLEVNSEYLQLLARHLIMTGNSLEF